MKVLVFTNHIPRRCYREEVRGSTEVMANVKSSNQVENAENVKNAIESGTELSQSEILNAYLANHAVEHFCAALSENEEEINGVLAECKKEEGVYWLYTQPAIDGTKADGNPLPTREEWENLNPEAVRVDNLAGKQWYKRPFVIGDARGVKSVVNAFDRYEDAKAGAKKKVANMAEGGLTAFATMTKEEKAAYLAKLQALLGE